MKTVKKVNYFPLHTDHYNTVKGLDVRSEYGNEGYALYIMVLQKLAQAQNRQLEYSKISKLAFDFHCDMELLKKVIDCCCELDGEYFYDQTLNEGLAWYDDKYDKSSLGGKKAAANLTPEQRKERAQKAASERWEKNQEKRLKAEVEQQVQFEEQISDNAKGKDEMLSTKHNDAKGKHIDANGKDAYANNRNINKNINKKEIRIEIEKELELESEPKEKEIKKESELELEHKETDLTDDTSIEGLDEGDNNTPINTEKPIEVVNEESKGNSSLEDNNSTESLNEGNIQIEDKPKITSKFTKNDNQRINLLNAWDKYNTQYPDFKLSFTHFEDLLMFSIFSMERLNKIDDLTSNHFFSLIENNLVQPYVDNIPNIGTKIKNDDSAKDMLEDIKNFVIELNK